MLNPEERLRLQTQFIDEFIETADQDIVISFAKNDITRTMNSLNNEEFIDFVQRTTNYQIIPERTN